MAEAVKQNTPTYNWTLDQAFHHLTVALGYPEKRALYEMEQLRAKVQKYVDGKPRGDPNYRYNMSSWKGLDGTLVAGWPNKMCGLFGLHLR